MADSIMYQEDCYVVLEPDRPEQFLSKEELLEKLKGILQQQDELPRDLQQFNSLSEQAQCLLDTACEFDVAPGRYLQWYATRLEKK
ncbi:MAG: chlororespiratory reduction protein 7 [Cyanobacteria bacterium SBLK]|nr:chlororespiratory reduction protein 7 [Cyanobacteria bacterium SBLK]